MGVSDVNYRALKGNGLSLYLEGIIRYQRFRDIKPADNGFRRYVFRRIYICMVKVITLPTPEDTPPRAVRSRRVSTTAARLRRVSWVNGEYRNPCKLRLVLNK